MSDTPNLPGFRSNAVPKKPAKQRFKYINGYAFENLKPDDTGVKREMADYAKLEKNSPKRPQAGPSKLPNWLAHDRLVYSFKAYFLESVSESNSESFRVRKCNILYYKSDGSIQVSEAKQENSGIPQGTFIKRHKIPSADGSRELGVDDLEVGDTVVMYGRTFKIVDCDDFTRNDMLANGYAVKDKLPYPEDKFTKARADFMRRQTGADSSVYRGACNNPMKEFMEATLGNASKNNRLLGQFLGNDRQVLRFDCYWDDTKRFAGELRFFKLHYYLSSDEIEIIESFPPNSGFDKMPKLLQKSKLKKPGSGGKFVGYNDLRIGGSLEVFHRKIMLTNADNFTRGFYQSKGVTLGPAIIKKRPVKILPRDKAPPAHGSSCFGTEADSRRSWESLHPKPPRKNLAQMMKFDGKVVYFKATMVADGSQFVAPNDKTRIFIFRYYLADDTVGIFEPPQRNSGHIGGKFLERGQHINRDTGKFFVEKDFTVNGKIRCCGRCFLISEGSGKSGEGGGSHMRTFSKANVQNIISKVENKLRRHATSLAKTFRLIDADKSNTVTYDEMKKFLKSYFSADELDEREVFVVMRYFDTDGEGRIDYNEFAAKILGKDVGENNYTTTSKIDGGDTMGEGNDGITMTAEDMQNYKKILIAAVETDKKEAFLTLSKEIFRQNVERLIGLDMTKLHAIFKVNDVGFNGTITRDRFESVLTKRDDGVFNFRMEGKGAKVVTEDIWLTTGLGEDSDMSRIQFFHAFAFGS